MSVFIEIKIWKIKYVELHFYLCDDNIVTTRGKPRQI